MRSQSGMGDDVCHQRCPSCKTLRFLHDLFFGFPMGASWSRSWNGHFWDLYVEIPTQGCWFHAPATQLSLVQVCFPQTICFLQGPPLRSEPKGNNLWHVGWGTRVLEEEVNIFGDVGSFAHLLRYDVRHQAPKEQHIILKTLLSFFLLNAFLPPLFSFSPGPHWSWKIDTFHFMVPKLGAGSAVWRHEDCLNLAIDDHIRSLSRGRRA